MIINIFLSQWPFQASKHVLLKNNQAIVSSVLSYCTVLATFFLTVLVLSCVTQLAMIMSCLKTMTVL